ncbi:uncharacterized protein LOC129700726 [Leucoraja erinacea]|uniref:uncharacterized protein LOC129700726 n=1 Tax=Leucoraja erinaceus TaxID=7782 RepID=UPI0024568ACF|nr:uncharacterized protein LOC129700726 [Leucoraja erinacea]
MEKMNGVERTSGNSYEPMAPMPDDPLECFICRERGVTDCDSLLQYCDCKSLVAHHKCLLTWIQKGHWKEDKPICRVCMVEYHLQNGSPWRLVAVRWQNWLTLSVILGLMAIMPIIVYKMMTAFKDPPPHLLFRAASVCFGLLSETLLIKLLIDCCSGRYRRAKMSSISIRGRSLEEGGGGGVNFLRPAGQSATADGMGSDKTLGLDPYV